MIARDDLEHDVRDRPRPRRPGDPRQHVARRLVHRDLPVDHARRGRDARLVPPVLVPRRRPEPRRAGDAGLDSRGRRARLLDQPRVRRRVRQSRSRRRVRRRRRRGGDRAARDELALEQVPRPGRRRRGAADPAPQRLQDREPDDPRPHLRRRAHRPLRRLRLGPVSRRRRRSRAGAPATGRDARPRAGRDPRDPTARPRRRRRHAAALADDRAAHAEGLDRARRWSTACRWKARGARTRCRSRRCARSRSTSLCSRRGCARTGPRSSSTSTAARARSSSAGSRRATRRMGSSPHANGGLLLRDLVLPDFRDYAVAVPSPGAVTAEATRVLGNYLRDVFRAQRRDTRLPAVRSRRDRVEPARRGVRGDREGVGGRRAPGRRRARPATAG